MDRGIGPGPEGGARFGYQLLWVLVMSTPWRCVQPWRAARIVRGLDLAQACRERLSAVIYSSAVGLCESPLRLATWHEVLGGGHGLNLCSGLRCGECGHLRRHAAVLCLQTFGIA